MKSNEFGISIHIVNIDLPTNLQNIIRAKLDNITQKLTGAQKERGLRKNLVFINNRDLKPIDMVLRMNPNPEVAFLGWNLPSFVNLKNNISPGLMRSKVLNDPQMARYKKAFLSQRLRNTLTVLVGDIGKIVSKAAEVGLTPQIFLKKERPERLENPEEIIDKARKNSLIPDDYLDEEVIEIDSTEDWQNFLRNHELAQISRMQILNLVFQSFIDIQETQNEYIFSEQPFNETFFKIWNIETKYLNLNYVSDLQEFNLIVANKPLLVVLPKELLSMTAGQMDLEGATKIYGFESFEETLKNHSQFNNVDFVGVMCRDEDKARLKELSSCQNACFFTVDDVVEKSLWEKFRRLEFDISNEREFDILSNNLQSSLDDLNFNLDPSLKKYVPTKLYDYLKDNFKLICGGIKAVINGKTLDGLSQEIKKLYQKESELLAEFKLKLSELDANKQNEFLPLKPIINDIKTSMQRVKLLKQKIDEIYHFNEKIELDAQQRLGEIEKCKERLRNIALKQFKMAKDLGLFLVSDLRKNISSFKTQTNTIQQAKHLAKQQRRIFNFNQEEWEVLLGCNIYFITRHKNIVRLLNTLLKSDQIKENSLIKAAVPDEKIKNADWIFYDQSCTESEIKTILAGGKSHFNQTNFNEVLTKTELEKSGIRKTLDRFEMFYQDKAKMIAEKENELYELSSEHDILLYKTRKQSAKYSKALQKFKVLNEIFNSYQLFYKEVSKKIEGIHRIMQKLELVAMEQKEAETSKVMLQARMTRQIISLTDIITSFYYSLAFLQFTTRILQLLPKLTQSFRWNVAQNQLEKSKLKHKLSGKKVQNVMIVSDESFASERIIENLISMLMLHFRINRDRFRITNVSRYRRYINQNIDYFAVVLTSDSNNLDALKYMIQDITSVVKDPVIFALCQYPSSLIAELEMMRDEKTIETLSYIRKHAFLSDAVHVKPDNKLHITSLYLYAIS